MMGQILQVEYSIQPTLKYFALVRSQRKDNICDKCHIWCHSSCEGLTKSETPPDGVAYFCRKCRIQCEREIEI